ncbi:serpin family protein [Streptomyces iakyrus]|uniref:serpin family protein n=1 Tax=Streptomyces iakyrus TaxID=68219 RepID=UPI003D929C69
MNGLTARWAGVSEDGTAFSAAGVWPLLAHLAGGAEGAARAELTEALGLPAGQARDAASELLVAMSAMRGLDTALGLWTKRTLELKEEWEAGLPADAHGVLTGDPVADHRALDAWTAKRTGGLIDRMPVTLAEDTKMVLASALTMRTQWLSPFREVDLETAYEPWAAKPRLGLRRSSAVLDRVGVADTPGGYVTELKVLGNNALDGRASGASRRRHPPVQHLRGMSSHLKHAVQGQGGAPASLETSASLALGSRPQRWS